MKTPTSGLAAAAAALFAAILVASSASPAAAQGGRRIELQLFGGPAWNGLRTSAEDGFGLVAGGETFSTTISGARNALDLGWGAGGRAMWGDWGVEAAYRFIRGRDLTPSYLLADAGAYDTFIQSLSVSPAGAGTAARLADFSSPETPRARTDLYFGQIVRRVPLVRGASLSVGVGGGFLRVTDAKTDALLARDWGGLPLPARLANSPALTADFAARRTSVAYGGSLAMTAEVGPMLVRPRLDVIVAGRALTTSVDYAVGASVLGGPLSGSVATSLRPIYFLATLEIGLRN